MADNDARILAQLGAINNQFSTLASKILSELAAVKYEAEKASAASQACLATMEAMNTAISGLSDSLSTLNDSISDIPTDDNTGTIDSTSDLVNEIKLTVDNINAGMIAFDPTIIADLESSVSALSEKIGDVPEGMDIWTYLQGVTNITQDDDGIVNTKVTGCVLDESEAAIKDALVEIINASSTTVGQTRTLSDGTWAIIVDSGATYTVRVSISGYKPFTKTIVIPSNATTYEVV